MIAFDIKQLKRLFDENAKDYGIKLPAIAVYFYLVFTAGKNGCYPTIIKIAKSLKCSKSTVIKALRNLEKAEFIRIKKVEDRKKRVKSFYEILKANTETIDTETINTETIEVEAVEYNPDTSNEITKFIPKLSERKYKTKKYNSYDTNNYQERIVKILGKIENAEKNGLDITKYQTELKEIVEEIKREKKIKAKAKEIEEKIDSIISSENYEELKRKSFWNWNNSEI
jgi:DNA-binding MarR family transcriptional regulator